METGDKRCPRGFIRGFTAEWTIPDFLSIELDVDDVIESPTFSLACHMWKLGLGVNKISRNHLLVYLKKDNPNVPTKTMKFSIGIKTKAGIVNERRSTFSEITELQYIGLSLLPLSDLKERESELLPGSKLTLVCRILRDFPLNPHELYSFRTMLVDLVEPLLSDLRDLRSSDRKHDVILNVQDRQFQAHRTILSARSPVFRAMFEHDTVEAKSGIVTIPDCDPDSFDDFLCYLYTGRTGEAVTVQAACHLYTTADKYHVDRLKLLCASYVANNFYDFALLADRQEELMALVQDFFNENFRKIFLTSEWTSMLKDNLGLANRLMKEMASVDSKSSNRK